MGNAYIVDACRTPRGIGKVGKGALAHLHPSYLGSTVLAAMAERNTSIKATKPMNPRQSRHVSVRLLDLLCCAVSFMSCLPLRVHRSQLFRGRFELMLGFPFVVGHLINLLPGGIHCHR